MRHRPAGHATLAVVALLVCYGGAVAQPSDRDGDRIPDATDQCPTEPETYNGFNDQDGCPDSFDQLFDLVAKDVDEYWRAELPQLGGEYEPPTVARLYTTSLVTACGDTLGPNNAYFSSCRRGLYFHQPLMEELFSQGDWIPAMVIAHEWGHLAQYTLGMFDTLPPGIFRELHADCFAGAYTAYVDEERSANLRLSPGDVDEALLGLFRIGDISVPWLNPQFHGTGGDRVDAFNWGYRYDAGGCNGSVFLARFGDVVDRRGTAIPGGQLKDLLPDPALGSYQLVDCHRLTERIGKQGETDAVQCRYDDGSGTSLTFTLLVHTTSERAGSAFERNRDLLGEQGWVRVRSGQISDGTQSLGSSLQLRNGANDVFMFTNGQLFGYLYGPSDDTTRFANMILPPS